MQLPLGSLKTLNTQNTMFKKLFDSLVWEIRINIKKRAAVCFFVVK